jgi:hypothetical protein
LQVGGLVGRFQYAPRETHIKEIKRILRYLKGTLEFGLWYPKEKYFTLNVYIDVDWVGIIDDRKSTNGGAFFLGIFMVACLSKKQTSTSLSTIEA